MKSEPKIPTIGGVQLSPSQWKTLKEGSYIYLENMNRSDGKGKFSSYVFLNDEKNKTVFSRQNTDDFIQYGKYEMCIWDKILIEAGFVTKAKVKWFGGLYFAYPYLWKENKSDAEYKEAWGDPRKPKEEKIEKQQNIERNAKKSNYSAPLL